MLWLIYTCFVLATLCNVKPLFCALGPAVHAVFFFPLFPVCYCPFIYWAIEFYQLSWDCCWVWFQPGQEGNALNQMPFFLHQLGFVLWCLQYMIQGLATKWQTLFPGTNHLCFDISCRQIQHPLPSPLHCWTFWLYRNQIGHQGSGQPCGKLFSPHFSPINSKIICISKEMLCCLLQQVQVQVPPLPPSEHQLCHFCELFSIRIP